MRSLTLLCALAICASSSAGPGREPGTSDVRLAMRQAEAISEAITNFYNDGGGTLATLKQLVPEYLDEVPSSPWGTSFDFIHTTPRNWEIRLRLPAPVCTRVQYLRHGAQGWVEYPRCVLTDEERHEQIIADLDAVRNAIESYHVDYNSYPESLAALVPVYLTFVPTRDPYGHAYQGSLSPDSFWLASLGRDGLPAGADWDADTIYSSDWFATSGVGFGTPFEYLLDALVTLRVVMTALEAYAVDYGEYPASLEVLGPTYIHNRRSLHDLYGNLLGYRLLAPSSYELVAAGRDGIEGTEDYEVRAADGQLTAVPNWELLYRRTQKTGLFEGGLLRRLPQH